MSRKNETQETVSDDPAKDTRDILKGADCAELWRSQPKGMPFTISCYMTPARQFVIAKIGHDGKGQLFAEVGGDSVNDQLQAILSA